MSDRYSSSNNHHRRVRIEKNEYNQTGSNSRVVQAGNNIIINPWFDLVDTNLLENVLRQCSCNKVVEIGVVKCPCNQPYEMGLIEYKNRKKNFKKSSNNYVYCQDEFEKVEATPLRAQPGSDYKFCVRNQLSSYTQPEREYKPLRNPFETYSRNTKVTNVNASVIDQEKYRRVEDHGTLNERNYVDDAYFRDKECGPNEQDLDGQIKIFVKVNQPYEDDDPVKQIHMGFFDQTGAGFELLGANPDDYETPVCKRETERLGEIRRQVADRLIEATQALERHNFAASQITGVTKSNNNNTNFMSKNNNENVRVTMDNADIRSTSTSYTTSTDTSSLTRSEATALDNRGRMNDDEKFLKKTVRPLYTKDNYDYILPPPPPTTTVTTTSAAVAKAAAAEEPAAEATADDKNEEVKKNERVKLTANLHLSIFQDENGNIVAKQHIDNKSVDRGDGLKFADDSSLPLMDPPSDEVIDGLDLTFGHNKNNNKDVQDIYNLNKTDAQYIQKNKNYYIQEKKLSKNNNNYYMETVEMQMSETSTLLSTNESTNDENELNYNYNNNNSNLNAVNYHCEYKIQKTMQRRQDSKTSTANDLSSYCTDNSSETFCKLAIDNKHNMTILPAHSEESYTSRSLLSELTFAENKNSNEKGDLEEIKMAAQNYIQKSEDADLAIKKDSQRKTRKSSKTDEIKKMLFNDKNDVEQNDYYGNNDKNMRVIRLRK